MKSESDWLDDDEQVKDYIVDIYGLYEGEGLKEAFKKWKSLPKEKRTEQRLDYICDSIANFSFDPYEPPEWLPVV
jgi:hypothetical protein